jgi:hypothetical protein
MTRKLIDICRKIAAAQGSSDVDASREGSSRMAARSGSKTTGAARFVVFCDCLGPAELGGFRKILQPRDAFCSQSRRGI